jgi:hypothetical protein
MTTNANAMARLRSAASNAGVTFGGNLSDTAVLGLVGAYLLDSAAHTATSNGNAFSITRSTARLEGLTITGLSDVGVLALIGNNVLGSDTTATSNTNALVRLRSLCAANSIDVAGLTDVGLIASVFTHQLDGGSVSRIHFPIAHFPNAHFPTAHFP